LLATYIKCLTSLENMIVAVPCDVTPVIHSFNDNVQILGGDRSIIAAHQVCFRF